MKYELTDIQADLITPLIIKEITKNQEWIDNHAKNNIRIDRDDLNDVTHAIESYKSIYKEIVGIEYKELDSNYHF